MPVTFQDVLRAWPVVHRWLPRTPLYRYPLLSARWGVDAWVKHENHMPIGAFKVRGGVNLFANLSDSQRARGVITATRGNHGLSLAWAARAFGSRAVIYVPKGNNPEKNAIMSALGAEVVEFGRDFDEARMEAEARARNELLRYVHPANEPLLIAGIGTMAMEIAEELPDADAVIVPIGGGSLLAGTIVALRTLRPDMQIIGVQAERADAMARSLEAGKLTSIENADTFADGLATRFAFELPFEIANGKVDRVVRVSEDEMKEAVRTALEGTHNAAEGAAAASYAAAFKLRGELARKKVVILHTGHNIDRNTLRWALGLFDA
ncbi:threonine dehydratase [Sandaracinus amylolyticus]|uniref:threonine dehydratase n=1 Tax=Sandaracinus amylolyticus TaxID=927083 RepID=UPI00069D8377|nr:threonine dehydratase [Sandaracinus amylolyticus]